MTGVTTTPDLLGRLVDDYAAGKIGADELAWSVEALPAPERTVPSLPWGPIRKLGRL